MGANSESYFLKLKIANIPNMKAPPKYNVSKTLYGYETRREFKLFRCKLKANEEGFTITIRRGAEGFGTPSEEIVFYKKTKNLTEAIRIIEKPPDKFGLRTATRLGFVGTGHILFN